MIAVTLMWSIAGVITRHLEHARSFEVTFWRSFFTVLSLLVILPFFQGREVFSKIRHAGASLWLSGICWSVMFTAFMLALTLTSVANVLVTMALAPLFTALAARAALGHRLAPRTWVAILLAGAGIAWMYGQELQGGRHLLGTAVALAVPLAAAVNWTLIQSLRGSAGAADMLPAVLLGALLSSAIMLPLAWPLQASTHDVGLLAMLGLVQLAVPCLISVALARVLPAPEISLLALLEVLFGVAWVWLFTSEAPTPAVITGGSLVLLTLAAHEAVGLLRRR